MAARHRDHPQGVRAAHAAKPREDRRSLISWSLYDWAYAPYTTLIITFVFPVYFAQGVVGNEIEGQTLWGYAMSISGLIVALLSPVLGAIADAGGSRKPWILVFSATCVAGSALFWLVEPGRSFIVPAILLAIISNVGFEFGIVFNNAILPDIVAKDRLGRWSGWAWALGYAGGLTALLITLFFLSHPAIAGFALDRAHAEQVRIIGPFVALWFAVFSVPLFLWTRDRKASRLGSVQIVRSGLSTLLHTLRGLSAKKNLALFLIAHMLYADALVAIFSFGGIYAAGTFGMTLTEVTSFGVLLNVTAGLGAFGFAWLDDWIGSRRTILLALACLIVTAVVTVLAGNRLWFWIAGAALGVFVGPAQAASRSLMAHLAPKDREAEYFGLFALSGKATAFLGPAIVGFATAMSHSLRIGLASALILLVTGAVLLFFVESPAPAHGIRAKQ